MASYDHALRSAIWAQELALMATASRFDLDLPADRALSNKLLSRLFLDMAASVQIDLFVEAGSQDGSVSRRAKAWFPNARVVAFEANPVSFGRYEAANRNAGVEFLNLALADRPGPVTMNLHRDEAGNTLDNGQGSLLKRDKARTDRTIGFNEVPIQAVRLDDFFADAPFERAALWMDVEGATGLVLPSAKNLLAKTALVFIEVEDQQYWGEQHWLRGDVMTFFTDLGFVPVARDFEYKHQYNVVFVRQDIFEGPNRVRANLARFHSSAVLPKDPAPAAAPARAESAAPSASVPESLPSGPAQVDGAARTADALLVLLRRAIRRARREVRRRKRRLAKARAARREPKR